MRLVPTLALLAVSTLVAAADSVHLVPLAPGVLTKPIATAGDAYNNGAGGTKNLVGLLDGMGAYDNGDGTMTVLVSHEAGKTRGVARAHGGIGAFISRLTITKSDLTVQKLEDLITSVKVFDATAGTWSTGTAVAFDRFCSSDLAVESATYNSTNGKGVPTSVGRLFFAGEETTDGRAFLHLSKTGGSLDGQSIQLPHLGRMAFENILLNPKSQDTTVALLMDDTSPGYLGLYVGTKAVLPGSPTIQDVATAAGLTGGMYYHIKANGLATEDRTTGIGTAKGITANFVCTALGTDGNAATTAFDTYAELTADAATKGTIFLRPEDGAWDPQNPTDFYFVTTDRIDDTKNGLNGTTTAGNVPASGTAPAPQVGRSRLWRLRFSDITNPATGGTITCLINGDENPGPQMMDNLTIDKNGRLLIQEDPGNVDFAAKIWTYQIATGSLTPVASFDPALNGALGAFSPALNAGKVSPAAPFSKDEESSGIIDAADLLGPGWFLLAAQQHRTTDSVTSSTEIIEGGSLVALYAPVPAPSVTNYTLTSGLMASVGTTAAKGVLVRESGWGSAMTFVPGTTDQVYLMSDRGPNVDGAVSGTKNFPVKAFQPRIGKFKMNSDGSMTLLATIGMKTAAGVAYSGLPLPTGSTGFTGETAFEINADGSVGTTAISDINGIDPEGLVALPDGTFWISDEYGPFLIRLAANGTEMERITTASTAPRKLPAVLASRIPNRGMEGLTLSPDGTRLIGVMQNALMNGQTESQAKKSPILRIVDITLADFSTKEYIVLLDESSTTSSPNTKNRVSEIVAVSATQFLIIERADAYPGAKNIYKIDISAATDVHDPTDATTGKLYPSLSIEALTKNLTTSAAKTAINTAGITEATKTLVVDLDQYLGGAYPHDKVEGLALRGSTLWVANDDDFGVTDNGAGGLKQKTVTGTAGASHGGVGLADFNQVVAIDLSKLATTVSVTNRSPVLTLAGLSTNYTTTVAKGTAVNVAVAGLDDETAATGLTASVAVTSGTSATAVLTGSPGSWTLGVTTLAAGTTVFTVSLSDGTTTVTKTATITVTNAAPTLTLDGAAADATKALTIGTGGTVAVVASDTETAAASLVVTVAQTSGSTIATAGLTGSAGTWSLVLTPLVVGTATFTVSVFDGANTTTRTVTANVTAPTAPTSGGSSSNNDDDDDKNGCGLGGGIAGLIATLGLALSRRRR